MSIERDIVRIQALNGAKENNAILLVVHKEDRHDMKAVGERDYATLPQEFREAFELLDEMTDEGLFTRKPHFDEGIIYTITAKGREA